MIEHNHPGQDLLERAIPELPPGLTAAPLDSIRARVRRRRRGFAVMAAAVALVTAIAIPAIYMIVRPTGHLPAPAKPPTRVDLPIGTPPPSVSPAYSLDVGIMDASMRTSGPSGKVTGDLRITVVGGGGFTGKKIVITFATNKDVQPAGSTWQDCTRDRAGTTITCLAPVPGPDPETRVRSYRFAIDLTDKPAFPTVTVQPYGGVDRRQGNNSVRVTTWTCHSGCARHMADVAVESGQFIVNSSGSVTAVQVTVRNNGPDQTDSPIHLAFNFSVPPKGDIWQRCAPLSALEPEIPECPVADLEVGESATYQFGVDGVPPTGLTVEIATWALDPVADNNRYSISGTG